MMMGTAEPQWRRGCLRCWHGGEGGGGGGHLVLGGDLERPEELGGDDLEVARLEHLLYKTRNGLMSHDN